METHKGQRRMQDFPGAEFPADGGWGWDTKPGKPSWLCPKPLFSLIISPWGALGSLNTTRDFPAKERSARGPATKIHHQLCTGRNQISGHACLSLLCCLSTRIWSFITEKLLRVCFNPWKEWKLCLKFSLMSALSWEIQQNSEFRT